MVCLIVDDDADTRDTVARLVSTRRVAVKTATNLYSALDLVKEVDGKAEMMLLDYNLPGMPMTEFLRKLKAINPELIIVLSTALDAKTKASKMGLNWYLPKPIMPEQLFELVDHLQIHSA
jgi:two-component system, NtrC family, response regulator AtoC